MNLKNIIFLHVQALLLVFYSLNALAAEGDIGPVYLEKVGVISVKSGGHLAGNFEIQVKGGFNVPNGLACDNTYITTLKSVDIDKRLFSLLVLSQVTKQALYLRITDDPAYTAFYGRCSLVWGSLAP
jgi:hypothetical protein